jgi:hypothetical protein
MAKADITEKELNDTSLMIYGVAYFELDARSKQLDVCCEILKRHLPQGSKVITDGENIRVEVPTILPG